MIYFNPLHVSLLLTSSGSVKNWRRSVFPLNFSEFLPLSGSSFLTRAFYVQGKPLQVRYRDRFLSSVFDTFCNAKETLNTFLGWYILFIVMIFCVFLSVALSLSSFCLNIPALYLTKDTSTA